MQHRLLKFIVGDNWLFSDPAATLRSQTSGDDL